MALPHAQVASRIRDAPLLLLLLLLLDRALGAQCRPDACRLSHDCARRPQLGCPVRKVALVATDAKARFLRRRCRHVGDATRSCIANASATMGSLQSSHSVLRHARCRACPRQHTHARHTHPRTSNIGHSCDLRGSSGSRSAAEWNLQHVPLRSHSSPRSHSCALNVNGTMPCAIAAASLRPCIQAPRGLVSRRVCSA